jgi:hypothetical protein
LCDGHDDVRLTCPAKKVDCRLAQNVADAQAPLFSELTQLLQQLRLQTQRKHLLQLTRTDFLAALDLRGSSQSSFTATALVRPVLVIHGDLSIGDS